MSIRMIRPVGLPSTHGHTGGADGSILNLSGPLDIADQGTVTVGAGTPNVVGDGTYFSINTISQQIMISGEIFRILSITDDTHLALDGNHIAGASGVQMFRERGHVAHGADALRAELNSPSRQDCTAIGYCAAINLLNFSGFTTAIGAKALANCTTGNNNIAVGASALFSNISGDSNLAFGNNALNYNVDGDKNTAFGTYTLLNNISGSENAAIGNSALFSNVTGNRNVAIGFEAGYNETGSEKLYIAKGRNDADVLIYGDFATRQIGIGTVTPDASSILDLTSTLRGFLPPRMTNTQRDAISSPVAALLLWSTTDNKYNYYNGSAWRSFVNTSPSTIGVGGILFGHADGSDCIDTDATNFFWHATDQNLGFRNGGTQFGGGKGVIGIGNRALVPGSNPIGGGVLYAESGALKWRGSSGTVTQIAPP